MDISLQMNPVHPWPISSPATAGAPPSEKSENTSAQITMNDIAVEMKN